MRCPACETGLVLGEGTKSYQTLEEHICDPNGDINPKEYYLCPNTACGIHDKVFWDHWGDTYSMTDDFWEISSEYKILYPFESFRMRSWIENEKNDEDFTLLNLWFVRWRLVYVYRADESCNITSRKPKVETHYRRHGGWSLHMSFWKMFRFSVEWFEMVLARYETNENNKTIHRELAREYENLVEGKPLYKRLAGWWVNRKYGHILKMIKLDELFSG